VANGLNIFQMLLVFTLKCRFHYLFTKKNIPLSSNRQNQILQRKLLHIRPESSSVNTKFCDKKSITIMMIMNFPKGLFFLLAHPVECIM